MKIHSYLEYQEQISFDSELPSNIVPNIEYVNTLIKQASVIPNNKVVVVRVLEDLPQAVGDMITLSENTTYVIAAHINLGTRFLSIPNQCSIVGLGASTSSLMGTYSGNSSMLLVRNRFTISNIKLTAYRADEFAFVKVFDLENVASLTLDGVTVSESLVGYFLNVDDIQVLNSNFQLLTRGFSFSGAINTIKLYNNKFTLPLAGVHLLDFDEVTDLTNVVDLQFNEFDFANVDNFVLSFPNPITAQTQSVILKNNILTGNGGVLTGDNYTGFDSLFYWSDNRGFINIAPNGSYYYKGNTTAISFAILDEIKLIPHTFTATDTTKDFELEFFYSPQYVGNVAKVFNVNVNIDFKGVVGETYEFYLAKKTALEDTDISTQSLTYTATKVIAHNADEKVSMDYNILFETGDSIYLVLQTKTSTLDVIVENCTLSIS